MRNDCKVSHFFKTLIIHTWYLYYKTKCVKRVSQIALTDNFSLFRFSSFVDLNVTRISKRRRILGKQNGLKLSVKLLVKSWLWILHLNLKNGVMSPSNIAVNYGNKLVRMALNYAKKFWNNFTIFFLLVEAMKRVEEIKEKRQAHHIKERQKKARSIERMKDVKEVQRDLALIKSPAAG